MTYKHKSWEEKLVDKESLAKILTLEKRFPCYNALHKMGVEAGEPVVLVNPSEIVEAMRGIPKGKLITIVEICKKIARKHKVKGCCSLTTGIFIMTAANAADENKKLGIPYWRTLKVGGFLNEKYPGSEQRQKKLLEEEGHKVSKKGKHYFVLDFEKKLVE